MSYLRLILLAITLTLLGFHEWIGELKYSHQIVASLFFILLLGVPHGAIDHILFSDKKPKRKGVFYLFYFGMMGIYLTGWFIAPQVSLIFFLVLSAFHFGQSQFSELKFKPRLLAYLLYLVWGVSILSGLIEYNFDQVLQIFSSSPDLKQLALLFDLTWTRPTWIVSSILTILLLLYLLAVGQLKSRRLVIELSILALIHLCFYALPLLIGFTVYFTVWHSLKVMAEEFQYLKEHRPKFSLRNFFQLLAPYTILSILGTLLLLGLSYMYSIGISYVLLTFILLSILTLPHSIVMDGFYARFYRKASSDQ